MVQLSGIITKHMVIWNKVVTDPIFNLDRVSVPSLITVNISDGTQWPSHIYQQQCAAGQKLGLYLTELQLMSCRSECYFWYHFVIYSSALEIFMTQPILDCKVTNFSIKFNSDLAELRDFVSRPSDTPHPPQKKKKSGRRERSGEYWGGWGVPSHKGCTAEIHNLRNRVFLIKTILWTFETLIP